jgi:lipopolysaccharide transport system permease protein
MNSTVNDSDDLFSLSSDDILIIEPGNTTKKYWLDIWKYRELFYFMAWRDILVRYKQTVIGVAWSVLRPLLTTIVFVIVFSYFAKLPSHHVPYPILVLAGMLPWQFFANALTESSNSLITNSNMLSKVYFPRLVIPASSVIVSLIDFLISFVILGLVMLYYQYAPSWRIIMLPVFTMMAFVASFGSGLWLASLNVKFRDFRYIVPFIVQFGLYISPVGYTSEVVPDQWRLLYSMNPMTGIIDGFRWAILGDAFPIYLPGFILSLITITIIAISGLFYFKKMEKGFADVI